MIWCAGIDEAGYGPLLGPLVVSATLWQVDDAHRDADLWAPLADCVGRASDHGDRRITIDDSKKVYDRKKGICTLERPVLAAASAAGLACDSLSNLLAALGARTDAAGIPWYDGLDTKLPIDRKGSAFEGVSRRLATCMQTAGVACRGLFSEVVTEDRFNARVGHTHNKSTVLLEHVLRLVQRVGRRCGAGELCLTVDRLGGRSDYRRVLLDAFPRWELHEIEVSSERSRYALTPAEPRADRPSRIGIDFVVEADAGHLPVALASMVSKYVRESLMMRFNAYWRGRLPAIRPTAGYYSDAQRFITEIQPALTEQDPPLERFVRTR